MLKGARRWNIKWEFFFLNLECAFWKFILRQWTSYKLTHNAWRHDFGSNNVYIQTKLQTARILWKLEDTHHPHHHLYQMECLDDDITHIQYTEHMTNSKYWSNKNIKEKKSYIFIKFIGFSCIHVLCIAWNLEKKIRTKNVK